MAPLAFTRPTYQPAHTILQSLGESAAFIWVHHDVATVMLLSTRFLADREKDEVEVPWWVVAQHIHSLKTAAQTQSMTPMPPRLSTAVRNTLHGGWCSASTWMARIGLQNAVAMCTCPCWHQPVYRQLTNLWAESASADHAACSGCPWVDAGPACCRPMWPCMRRVHTCRLSYQRLAPLPMEDGFLGDDEATLMVCVIVWSQSLLLWCTLPTSPDIAAAWQCLCMLLSAACLRPTPPRMRGPKHGFPTSSAALLLPTHRPSTPRTQLSLGPPWAPSWPTWAWVAQRSWKLWCSWWGLTAAWCTSRWVRWKLGVWMWVWVIGLAVGRGVVGDEVQTYAQAWIGAARHASLVHVVVRRDKHV